MTPLQESISQPLEIFETLRFDPIKGYIRLNLHLNRLKKSCAAFGIKLEARAVLETLEQQRRPKASRVRLSVRQGDRKPNIAFFEAPPDAKIWKIAVHGDRVNPQEVWRRHKTNRRQIYDNARQSLPPDLDEWLFLNDKEELCEGSITNVFVKQDGIFLTPPLNSGALPGVLRQALLDNGKVEIQKLFLADLTEPEAQIYVGNSLRGLVKTNLITQ